MAGRCVRVLVPAILNPAKPRPKSSSSRGSLTRLLRLEFLLARMSLLERTRPGLGIIEPCLPSPAKVPPAGAGWLHEIKHDGFRILARRDGAGVRLFTRNGNDFTPWFPLAADAITRLPAYSFLLDGEAIVTNERGLAVFELIRRHRHPAMRF